MQLNLMLATVICDGGPQCREEWRTHHVIVVKTIFIKKKVSSKTTFQKPLFKNYFSKTTFHQKTHTHQKTHFHQKPTVIRNHFHHKSH